MANVLLTWELGGGLGHCVKLAPLACGLVDRGHNVHFAARDVATARKVLRNDRVKYLQSPCVVAKPSQVSRQPRSFAQVLDQVGFGDDQILESLVISWRNLFELVQPELIVCEHSPSALLASRWTNAHVAVMGTGFSLPPNVVPLPDLAPFPGPLSINLAAYENQLLRRVNRVLDAGGLSGLHQLSQLYAAAQESFLMTFRELDHHPHRGDAEYLGCWSPSNGIEPQWPEGDGPRIFAYLKSFAPNFRLDMAISILRELPARTLVYVPGASRRITAMQSRSLRVVAEPVQISAVLPQCDVAVLNGTAGTATQCLLAGVPLVMMPFFLEQVVFAHRIVELRAGEMINPNRIEVLAARLWRVLQNDSYRAAAKAFAARYAAFDPEKTQRHVMNRLERLLTRRSQPSTQIRTSFSPVAATID
jgi:UDP:flavonoid glycosyltransferase YjiC (YdhE family)